MNTVLPSGVWIVPLPATRLNVCGDPGPLPGAQIIPSFGAPVGRAFALPRRRTSDPVAGASRSPSRRVLCVIVGVLPLVVSLGSDIGLAHEVLGRQRVLVDAHLGHHPAGPGRAVVRQPAPIPVLEVVDVVV